MSISMVLKRHVFVSVLGLYQTWKQCPSVVMYSALLILPLKTKWIYRPFDELDFENEADLRYLSQTSFSDTTETKEFIRLLRFKHGQGLLFCMLDDYELETHQSPLILPVWYHLNQKLMSLYDAVTGTTYNGIRLDVEWWRNKKQFTSEYGVKGSNVMSELFFCAMKFNPIKEMLYQSNPDSLIPVQSYQYEAGIGEVSLAQTIDIFDDFEANDDPTNWWVSDDYDPYDLDDDVLKSDTQ
eukprot:592948_1